MEIALACGVQTLMLVQVSSTYAWLRLKHFWTRHLDYEYDQPVSVPKRSLSVIIPAYREASTIEGTLEALNEAASQSLEVVVVDADGNDGTMDLVRGFKGEKLRFKYTTSKGGRGPAVAAGAKAAEGECLLFLHADTKLPRNFDTKVLDALTKPGTLATAFQFRVDRTTIASAMTPYRVMELAVRLRSTLLQLPFGDQALALTKERFKQLGGFSDLAEVPMLEDFLLVQRLRILGARGRGRIVEIPEPAACSARRWSRSSVWRVNLTNQRVMFLYTFFNYDANAIFQLYYGMKAS